MIGTVVNPTTLVPQAPHPRATPRARLGLRALPLPRSKLGTQQQELYGICLDMQPGCKASYIYAAVVASMTQAQVRIWNIQQLCAPYCRLQAVATAAAEPRSLSLIGPRVMRAMCVSHGVSLLSVCAFDTARHNTGRVGPVFQLLSVSCRKQHQELSLAIAVHCDLSCAVLQGLSHGAYWDPNTIAPIGFDSAAAREALRVLRELARYGPDGSLECELVNSDFIDGACAFTIDWDIAAG